MKKALLLSVAAIAINACGPSQHRAPLSRNLLKTTADSKTQDVLTKKTESIIASMYGSTNGSLAGFKALNSTESSKKLQSALMGVSLKLEEVPNEDPTGDRYFFSTLSTVRKADKKCDLKSNQQQMYSYSELLSKNNKTGSNLRCLDEKCEQVLLLIEERKEVQVGARKESEYAVAAIVLNKGKDGLYNPMEMNSSVIAKVSSSELGSKMCAEAVLKDLALTIPQSQNIDVNAIIREDNTKKEAAKFLESIDSRFEI